MPTGAVVAVAEATLKAFHAPMPPAAARACEWVSAYHVAARSDRPVGTIASADGILGHVEVAPTTREAVLDHVAVDRARTSGAAHSTG